MHLIKVSLKPKANRADGWKKANDQSRMKFLLSRRIDTLHHKLHFRSSTVSVLYYVSLPTVLRSGLSTSLFSLSCPPLFGNNAPISFK
jgi:hypothetical protein